MLLRLAAAVWLVASASGCHGDSTECPALFICVATQAEADQANAGLACPSYRTCPMADGGASDAGVAADVTVPGDGAVIDVGSDVPEGGDGE